MSGRVDWDMVTEEKKGERKRMPVYDECRARLTSVQVTTCDDRRGIPIAMLDVYCHARP